MAVSEEQLANRSEKLKGLTIVISGTFSKHSRDEYKAMIEQHGGKNSGSVSGKTDYILAGENMGPAKLEKAAKLGVKIINEDAFLNMLGINVYELFYQEEDTGFSVGRRGVRIVPFPWMRHVRFWSCII